VVQHTTGRAVTNDPTVQPSPAQQLSPAFSLAELTAITRDNPQKLVDILRLFLENCPQEVEKLVQATRQQHWSNLANLAHKLRSPFGQIKAEGLVKELHMIEEKASEPQPEPRELQRAAQLFAAQAQVIFDRLEKEMLTVAEAI
jgi:HPt (histidine-containing phosphotransfer) domain-containing protein